ncbi:hypothetical protein N431DRAFT_551368 [Stipitochalara longipes BDJ]|nr:hypothetical protein N431DRAFT_551368 [Stipitochalara longipes BDJ]
MSDNHQMPHDTSQQRGHLSSFALRFRSQRKKCAEMATPAGKNKNPLYKLPPELRQEIFRPMLIPWNGKTPNLIKALRADQKLYHEALEVFYKQNLFKLHRANGWSFGDMTKEAVLSIEKIKIYVEPDIMSTGLWKVGGSTNEESVLTPIIPATLSDSKNIREVILDFVQRSDDVVIPPFIEYGSIAYSSNYFLVNFKILQRVEMGLPQPHFRRRDLEFLQDGRESSYMNGIKMVNDRLGVPGKLLTVPALQIQESDVEEDELRAMNGREVWFWQAAKGMFLKPRKMRDITEDFLFY